MTTQSAGEMYDHGEVHRVKPFPLSQLGDSWRTVHRDGKDVDRFRRNSTNNHKAYSAKWTIENDRLYLTDFHAFDENWRELSMQDVFGTSKLFAFWFSGELFSNLGERLYGMYNPTFERNKVWRFEHGVVKERFVRTNDTPEHLEEAARYRKFMDNFDL